MCKPCQARCILRWKNTECCRQTSSSFARRALRRMRVKIFRISMYPDGKRTTVVPESFQIILRQYLGHPEAKSLAPDVTACRGATKGLLRRALVVASEIVPIGNWEQGEDSSFVDFKVAEYRRNAKMVIAEASDWKRWRASGVRLAIRRSGKDRKSSLLFVIRHRNPLWAQWQYGSRAYHILKCCLVASPVRTLPTPVFTS